MTRHIFGAMITLLLVTSGSLQRQQRGLYTVDLAQSAIDITIFEEGLLSRVRPSHAIRAKNFTGSMSYIPGKELQATAEIDAEAKSLVNVEKEIGETERREFEAALHNVVLEAPTYPRIIFRSTSISDLRSTGRGHSFTLNGDLTMHGVTRRIAVPVVVVVNGKLLSATGDITFKQTEFQMKPYTAALGLIKIRDDVKVNFSIVAKTT